MECKSPECKKEFEGAIDSLTEKAVALENNLYGEGPEGEGGVYGALKKKVSYKVLTLLLSAVVGVIGFFAGFGINHESRLSKTETHVETNTGVIKGLCIDVTDIKVQGAISTRKILEAIERLDKKQSEIKD